MNAFMVGVMHQWVQQPGAYDLERAAPQMIDLFLAGLARAAAAAASQAPRRAARAFGHNSQIPATTRESDMSKIQKVGVIGAGTMGNGIAQACAVSGIDVVMVDVADAAVKRGVATITGSLDRLLKKDKIAAADRDAALARIDGTTDYDALKSVDLVIEAATENQELKYKILRQVDGLAKPSAIIASNTSSISITQLAAVTSRPEAFIGMHFFNPVPMMALVELIRGPADRGRHGRGGGSVRRSASARRRSSCKNSPGFVVNRILCPMLNEAIFALQEGLAIGRGHRQRDEARLQPPDRAAGARRHDRARRAARGDERLLRRLQRPEVPPRAAAEGDGRGRLSRAQDRARVLHLRLSAAT